jgi:hypothetical protein
MDPSPDGSTVFVTGWVASGQRGDDYATVAYDAATGVREWGRRYNGPNDSGDVAHAVAVSPDGSRVFVTGYSGGVQTGSDYATVAYET